MNVRMIDTNVIKMDTAITLSDSIIVRAILVIPELALTVQVIFYFNTYVIFQVSIMIFTKFPILIIH